MQPAVASVHLLIITFNGRPKTGQSSTAQKNHSNNNRSTHEYRARSGRGDV